MNKKKRINSSFKDCGTTVLSKNYFSLYCEAKGFMTGGSPPTYNKAQNFGLQGPPLFFEKNKPFLNCILSIEKIKISILLSTNCIYYCK